MYAQRLAGIIYVLLVIEDRIAAVKQGDKKKIDQGNV